MFLVIYRTHMRRRMKKTNKETLLLANYFHDFMESREGIRQPGTISGYQEAMVLYCRFLENEKKIHADELDFSKFNFDYLSEWKNYLHKQQGNKKSTCNLRISQIRGFFKWLKKKQPQYSYIYYNIKDVDCFKLEKNGTTQSLSEEAVSVLLSTPGTNTNTGLKYTTLMSLHYGCGIRSDEALSIKLMDLNIECLRPNIIVTGKGRKKRCVSIPKKTLRILKKYIVHFHGNTYDPEAYLFFSPPKGKYIKMTESAYNKQMDVYSRRAHAKNSACPEHVHPHQLRHSFATHALDHGIDIYQISKTLGHEDVSTTQKYLGVTPGLKMQALMKTESFVARNTKVNWKKNKKLEDYFRI